MIVFPRARRWATLTLRGFDADSDPRTLADWAALASVSVPSLRATCYLAGVSPRRGLIFVRLCRALILARAMKCRPEDLLDVSDPRSARSILRAAGLNDLPDRWNIATFIEQQQLIRDPHLIDALRRSLSVAADPR